MAIRSVGVAILGLGTIGSAVARTIAGRRELIRKRYDIDISVTSAMERSPSRARKAALSQDVIVDNIDAIVAHPEVHVVVEVLGGAQPAADFMASALESGKHVVTANKEALSKHFSRLTQLASANDCALLFEASVGGGIPLMVSYRQILAANQVTSVRGIVNGTTNFILSQMAEQGMAYEDALAEAKRLGYAEPDPTADVEGFDAAYKLAIMASMMTGRHVMPEDVDRTGITNVTAQEVNEARERGGAIKLIAGAVQSDGDLTLRVGPEFVPGENLLAHVRDNFNAVEVVGDRVGPVILSGQGAGPLPTASAIVSDVVEAARTGSIASFRMG